MYKKALSVLLALVMCLALVPMTALAAESISIGKTTYAPGEKIVVTATDITQKMVDGDAFVAIYDAGAPHDIESRQEHKFLSNVGANTVELTAPNKNGNYEIRFYNKDGFSSNLPGYFVMKVAFTVGNSTPATSEPTTPPATTTPTTPADTASFTLDKTAYAAGEKIIVTATDITQKMVDGDAFVAIYDAGAPHDIESRQEHKFLSNVGANTVELTAPNKNGNYEIRFYNKDGHSSNLPGYFVMKVAFTVINASPWATDTLQKADDMGLIPDSLRGADLTKPITRKEFAAVAVKTYENLTGKTTTPVAKNPFTDTNDTEVLKAYNVGLTSGTAADKFSPDVLLNREQAATMLTRVLKAAYITGWTLPTDGNYTLNFTQPAKFADDDKISDWAKPSVYFMAANGIIAGTGNNMFSPRAITTAEQAANYASATREQALVIAVRMVENLKSKPLDYKEGAAQGTTTPEPTQPTQGSDSLIGIWAYLNSGNWYERVYQLNSDGTFTAYELISGSQTLSDSSNNVVHQTGQTTYLFTKGDYKVNGNNIEFYSKQAFNDLTVDEKNAITRGASIQEIFSIVSDSRWRDVSVDVKEMPYEWVDSGTIKVTLSNGSKWNIVKVSAEDINKRYK